MKPTWVAVLLLAASCAAPAARKPDVFIPIQPAEPSVFDVDSVADSETRRYQIPEDFFRGPPRGAFINPEPQITEYIDPLWPVVHVAEIVRSMVAPRSWEDPRRALYVVRDELVVRHAADVQERVANLIDTLKSHRSKLIRFRAWPVVIPAQGGVGIERLERVSGGLAGVFEMSDLRLLDPKAFSRTSASATPNIFVFVGQASQVLVRQSKVLIEGYEPREDGPAQIGVLHHGLTLNLRGVPNGPASEALLIDVTLERRNLQSIRDLPLGAGIVHRPELAESRTSGRFVVAPGRAILLVPHATPGASLWAEALAIEAETVDLEERDK